MKRRPDVTLQLLKPDDWPESNTAFGGGGGEVVLTNFEEVSAIKYSTLSRKVDFMHLKAKIKTYTVMPKLYFRNFVAMFKRLISQGLLTIQNPDI